MQLSTSELAQLLLQQVTGRHKALTFTQMTKRLDMYKSVPHSLSQRMSQPGRASFECALQELAQLLYQLKTGGHKALIFTQMTKMLDVLEAFLNLHGYTYLRLDGTTKPEQRQVHLALHTRNAHTNQ